MNREQIYAELLDGIKRRIGVGIGAKGASEEWLLDHIRGMQRFVLGWEKRYEQALAHLDSRWIPVTERLPPLVRCDGTEQKIGNQVFRPMWFTDEVLIRKSNGRYGIADMIAKHDKSDQQWYAASGVTHWQPLPPAPPKQDESR